jgi:hypothetical protein
MPWVQEKTKEFDLGMDKDAERSSQGIKLLKSSFFSLAGKNIQRERVLKSIVCDKKDSEYGDYLTSFLPPSNYHTSVDLNLAQKL